MKRISTATAVQNRFVDGNKSTGQKATQFSAEWCNQIQEEIAGLLEGNGITLGGSENQLFGLFSKIFSVGFGAIEMKKSGEFESIKIALDPEQKYIVISKTQRGGMTSQVAIGPDYIRQLSSGLLGIAISGGMLKIVSPDGTQTIAQLSYGNDKFSIDHGLDVSGNVNATGPIKSTGGAVVGKSLEATAGGVQATGDISTSNGNLSGKNVNATGNIQTTNGNVSASGDVTAKNGKAVLSENNQRPAGLWMNDGASSNRKEASVAMDANGQLNLSGDGGVNIAGGQVTFYPAGYSLLNKPCTMAVGPWSPGYSAVYPLIATNQDVDLTTYTNYPNCAVLTIVNTKDGGITVTCTNGDDDIPKGGFSTYLRYGDGWYFHAGRT